MAARRVFLVRRKVKGVDARPVNRAQTHRARLAACINVAAVQLERTDFLASRSNGHNFGMRGWIVIRRNEVGSARDHVALFYDERAERPSEAASHILHRERDRLPQKPFMLNRHVQQLYRCDNTFILTQQLAIRSTRVVLPDGVQPACVIVENGRISAITPHAVLPQDASLRDFESAFVLPGLIDTHIHINEPGRTEWEGFETATRAAAAGGYTCVVDMPLNSIPATTNVEALEEKRAVAHGKALVDYSFWGGAVEGNAAELKPLAEAGVAGFKAFLVPSGVNEFAMLDEAGLREAMPLIATTGLPFLVHAELPNALEKATGDPRKYNNYLHSRPDEAELQAIRLMIKLVREYRCRVHIVHLATSHAIAELRDARAEGLPITVETCPHYLYFSAESISDGATQFKCAPPIRAAFNRDRLWQALREGDVDLIATDHSPCTLDLKHMESGNFQTAWGGIASVSLALSAVWSEARLRDFSISEVVRWLCEQPAALSGLTSRKGRLAVGLDADITIFNPDSSWHVTPESLHFRNKVSPYLGERFTGQVKATFLRGELVYEDGRFPAPPRGQEYRVGKA